MYKAMLSRRLQFATPIPMFLIGIHRTTNHTPVHNTAADAILPVT